MRRTAGPVWIPNARYSLIIDAANRDGGLAMLTAWDGAEALRQLGCQPFTGSADTNDVELDHVVGHRWWTYHGFVGDSA